MEKRDIARNGELQRPVVPSATHGSIPIAVGVSTDTSRRRKAALQPAGRTQTRPQASLRLEEVDVRVLLSALERSSSTHRANQGPLPLDKNERARVLTTRRRSKHRLRVQEERKLLQHQEMALRIQLAALQRVEASALTATQWQAVATQQLTNRLMAENRQLQLREAVARQGAAIQSLRARLLTHGRTKRRSTVGQTPIHSGAVDRFILEGFLHEMDSLYVQTDAVLSACGLGYTPTPPSSYYKPQRRKDAQVGEFLESKASITLPFDYTRLSWAVWHCPRRIQRLHDRTARLDGVEDVVNTLAASFDLDVYHYEGQNVVLGYDGVVRRYMESTRTVFVWRGLTEGKDENAGFYIDETGWCVLQPSPEPGSTLVQTYQRYVPTHLLRNKKVSRSTEGAREEDMAGGQLTEIMLQAWDDVILDLMRMTEYVILDDAARVDTDAVGVGPQF